MMKKHSFCPVCAAEQFIEYAHIKDFFLTQEVFKVDQCNVCGLLLTNPFPENSEISKYYDSTEYFSHPDKKKSIIGWVYEWVKKRNIRYKFKLATSGILAGNVLDIGCGSGDFLFYAKSKFWNVSGIEPNDKARAFSQKKTESLIYHPEKINSIADSSFDVITMWHVLEHVEELNEQCKQIKRLIKPGGRIVIALPNIGSEDAKRYGNYWAGFDVPRHLYHFGFDQIRMLMNNHGFGFLKREPLHWDAYYVSMLSEKYRYKRINPFRFVINGWISNIKARKSREFSSNVYIFYAV